MPKYVIERTLPGAGKLSADELHSISAKSNQVLSDMGGRAKWLEPATDATLASIGREGRSVAIFAPGFAADCLETREELAIRGKEQFEDAGGTHFAYLPCLNDSAPGMTMLETLVGRELAGWL